MCQKAFCGSGNSCMPSTTTVRSVANTDRWALRSDLVVGSFCSGRWGELGDERRFSISDLRNNAPLQHLAAIRTFYLLRHHAARPAPLRSWSRSALLKEAYIYPTLTGFISLCQLDSQLHRKDQWSTNIFLCSSGTRNLQVNALDAEWRTCQRLEELELWTLARLYWSASKSSCPHSEQRVHAVSTRLICCRKMHCFLRNAYIPPNLQVNAMYTLSNNALESIQL